MPTRARRTAGALAAMLLVAAGPSAAHEFWIDPDGSGGADMRVGEMLSGAALPYQEEVVASAELIAPDGDRRMLTSRIGDRPALRLPGGGEAAGRVAMVTRPAYVTFETLAEFEEYLDYEGLGRFARVHLDRGLPPEGISEEYVRHAIALLGPGSGAQIPAGLDLEIVPSVDPLGGLPRRVSFDVIWKGAPTPGIQVALFLRAGSEDARRTLAISDADGRVAFDIAARGQHLLSAVRMRPADGPGAVRWRTDWASLHFEPGG